MDGTGTTVAPKRPLTQPRPPPKATAATPKVPDLTPQGRAKAIAAGRKRQVQVDALIELAKKKKWTPGQFATKLKKISSNMAEVFRDLTKEDGQQKTFGGLAKDLGENRGSIHRLKIKFSELCRDMGWSVAAVPASETDLEHARAIAAGIERQGKVKTLTKRVMKEKWSLDQFAAELKKISSNMAAVFRDLTAPAGCKQKARRDLAKDLGESMGVINRWKISFSKLCVKMNWPIAARTDRSEAAAQSWQHRKARATPPGQRGFVTVGALSAPITVPLKMGAQVLMQIKNVAGYIPRSVRTPLQHGATFFLGELLAKAAWGDWGYFRDYSAPKALRNYAAMTIGGHAGHVVSSGLQVMGWLGRSPVVHGLFNEVLPLWGAITASHVAETGRVEWTRLPRGAAEVLAANQMVKGAALLLSHSRVAVALGRIMGLVNTAGKCSPWGAVVNMAAQFFVIDGIERIDRSLTDQEMRLRVTERLLKAIHHDQRALARDHRGCHYGRDPADRG